MTTVEKLLVQIFDRKNSIIEQVKQQTELYNQHLASKLLIEGITPPSWIWSPNNSGSKELDKEELLARVLRPDPQPSARCSSVYYPFYNNLIRTRDNGEFFEGCLLETLASKKDFNKQDDPVVPVVCPELGASITSAEDQPDKTCNKNHDDQDGPVMPASSENKACCASKNVPDQDFSITTPGDRTDERILNIYNASNQSLVRIQRSKSRQKAIEHRGSAKSLPKSGLNQESISDDLQLPSLPIEYSNQMNEPPKLVEHSGERCKDCLVDEYDRQHSEKGVDVYIGRVTTSRRNVEVPDFGSCSIGLSCSANNCRHVSSDGAGVGASSPSLIFDSKHGKHVMKSQKSARPSALCVQSYRGMILDSAYCQGTDVVTNSCNGVIARSKFLGRSQTFASDSSKTNSSSGNSHRKDNLTMEYAENLTVDYPDAFLTRVNQADVFNEGFGSRELLADGCMGQKEMGVVDGYDEDCITLISVSEDFNIQKEIGSIDGCGTLTKSRSLSHENASAEKYSDGKIHSYNMEADFRTLPFPTGEAALQASAHNQELGLATPSVPVDLGTRSKSQAHEQEMSNALHHPEMHCSGSMLRSGLKSKTTSDECLNASGGDITSPCKTHCKVYFHNMEADFRTSPFSTGEAALKASAYNQELGLVTPSVPVDLGTRTKSQVHEQEMSNALHHPEMHCSGSMLRSGLKRKTTSDECLNASGGDIASLCKTHCEVNELGDAGMLLGSEFILCNIDDPSDGISSTDAKHRREMHSVAFPSNSSAFLEHKQLGFDVFENYNSVCPTFGSGSKRLDNSSKKIACTLDPSTPIDKEIPGAICQVSFAEESVDKSDFLIEGKKIWTDSLDLNCLEKLQPTAENHAPTGSGYNRSRTCLGNTERSLNREYSGVQDELGNVPSETDANPDLLIPVELHLEPVHDSFIDQHSEEENLNAEEQDFSMLASNVSARENCLLSSSLDPVNQASTDDYLIGDWEKTDVAVTAHEKIIQMQPEESQALPCLESEVSDQLADLLPIDDNGLIRTSLAGSLEVEDFSVEKRFRRSCIKSWPNIKRRKIEHQQSYNCTTSANFRVRKLHSSQKGLATRYLQGVEMDAETMLIDASEVSKRIEMEMDQQIVFDSTEGLESTLRTENEEVPLSCKEVNEHESSSTVASDEQLRLTHVYSLTNKESRKSDHLGIKTPCTTDDYLNASDFDDKQCGIHSSCLDKDTYVGKHEKLTLSDRIGTKSSQLEDEQRSRCSMISPSNNDLEFISVEQCMPVYEGFSVDAQENCDDGFAADEIDFDKLNLPTTTTERASILAKICRSASMNTPLSNLSPSLEFQGTHDTFQSVPNGLTESLDLKVNSSLTADVGKQIGYESSLAYNVNYSLESMPASDCLTYSGARYMRNLRNGYTSPVGKLWERLSYHTGSSETSLNSNPELTCFRIEEDPCVSEDNNSIDKVADDVEEEIDSVSANHHNKRHPLTEMTIFSLVPPASDSVQDDILIVESANFVSTNPSVVTTQNNVQQSNRKQTSSLDSSALRKNQTSTIRANRMRKAKESVNSSVRKPVLRSTSSIRTPGRTPSFKESRKNNIISNVHSFLPLVQQQKASICAGKRDVKVKALEAAEAAKRLEERKENERKIRKEALKIERAKLEERNLRQQELEKKRKEDERKKKDANVIVKKRLREEEERNEKEKKRMRLDARQRQKEQEEKIRVEKAEKEKQRSKEDRMNNKKEVNESKKQQNKDIVKGVGSASVMNHNESSYSLEVGKALDNTPTPTNAEMIAQKGRENSYEISPYQGSDDEDDEDEDLRTRKFIPSWARKSSVAQLVSLQQEMDPNVIFPSQRSCSMDDVLQPRKLSQK